MDDELYAQKEKTRQDKYEALCTRCGVCCGALNDPCLNLAKDADNKYYCKVYEDRFKEQSTVSGKHFRCIPIRILRGSGIKYPNCPYFK